MKRTLLSAALLAAIAFSIGPAQAASFSYHGNLQDAGKPAEGNYDLELTLYSAAEGGKIVAGPLMMYKVPVHNGTFSTEADFGPLTQASGGTWLAVKVRNAGKGEFAALSARAPLGADATAVNSGCPGSWSLDGNAGNPAVSYLGTSDAQPLNLNVYGERAFQLTEVGTITGYHCVNVIGGAYTNSITGSCGTIAGGGSLDTGDYSNKVTDSFGSILGGESNSADHYASVLGGSQNVASGFGSTVLGGNGNQAGGTDSLAAGHTAHVRDAAEAGVVDGDKGTFVWADSNGAGLSSTGANQFDIRATGGMAINGVPANASTELTVRAGSADQYGGSADIELLSNTTEGYEFTATHGAGGSTADDSVLFVGRIATATSPHYVTVLQINANGSLQTFNDSPLKPTAGSWVGSSDRRIKHDIAPIGNALDTVMRLHPVSFHYNADYRASENGLADNTYLGFIAQDFAEVFPDAVISTGKKVPGAAPQDASILGLDPTPALITTVAAVQELAVNDQVSNDRISTLERENATLRDKLDEVLARLSKLEAGKGQ